MSEKEIDLGKGRKGYIHFEEGGVGILETIVTGGAALVVEKTLDAVSGDDHHGWYCIITAKGTDINASCWGSTKDEAKEKTVRAIQEKLDDHDYNVRRKEEARHQQHLADLERLRNQNRSSTYQSDSSTGSSDGEIEGCLVKAVIYLVLIFLAIWFVFSVAIPLILINTAIITLIAAFIKPKWNKLLLWVAIITGALVVLDYNAGWISGALIQNISMSLNALKVFMYINLTAGLIAAYFVIRNYLDEKYPKANAQEEISNRNLLVIGGLVLIGGLTYFGQSYLDRNNSLDVAVVEEDNSFSATNKRAGYINRSGTDSDTYSNESDQLNQAAYIKTKEGSNLRLRSFPSLDAEIITLIPDLSDITILEYDKSIQEVNGESGRWCKIDYNGQVGWAWGGFIYTK